MPRTKKTAPVLDPLEAMLTRLKLTTLVDSLAKAHAEKRLEDRLLSLGKPKLLIVDEIGYLPLEPDAALFFQLVSRRYDCEFCSAARHGLILGRGLNRL